MAWLPDSFLPRSSASNIYSFPKMPHATKPIKLFDPYPFPSKLQCALPDIKMWWSKGMWEKVKEIEQHSWAAEQMWGQRRGRMRISSVCVRILVHTEIPHGWVLTFLCPRTTKHSYASMWIPGTEPGGNTNPDPAEKAGQWGLDCSRVCVIVISLRPWQVHKPARPISSVEPLSLARPAWQRVPTS